MDTGQTIRVTCRGADLLPIDALREFQGEIKKLSAKNAERLEKSILRYGFTAPIFVWQHDGENHILDGHQRLKVLLGMRRKGYDIPLLPVDYIQGDTIEEAKAKLVHILSQYGEIVLDGLYTFSAELRLDDSTAIEGFTPTLHMTPGDYEEQKQDLTPYKMVHVLISFPPAIFPKVQGLLDALSKIDGVEYEQSAN